MPSQDRKVSTEPRSGGIQVIARAAAIMRALGGNPHGLSLGAIAQVVGLPRSTVQRIVCALETEGLVESVGPSGGFRLGPELGRLIYQSQIDIISVVRPVLEELSHTLQESVVLCGMECDQTVVIDRVVAERELRIVFPVGVIRVPAYLTATGKALLAEVPADQLEQVLSSASSSTDKKKLDTEALLAELSEIRSSGIAVDYEEYEEGIAAFATAVNTYLGSFSIAAIVPMSRAHKPINVFKQPLLECKAKIEHRIGKQELAKNE